MGLLVIGMNFIGNIWVAVPFLILLGGLGGFLVVPMNALLQHRGHNLMGAGRSIAVQNFNEQACILVPGRVLQRLHRPRPVGVHGASPPSAWWWRASCGSSSAGTQNNLQAPSGRGRAPARPSPRSDKHRTERALVPRFHRHMPALALIFNAFVWGVSWFPFRQLAGAWPASAVGHLPRSTPAIARVMAHARGSACRGCSPGRRRCWLLGLAAGFTNVGFNWAVTQGDVVRVVLLFYLMPLWSVLLGWAAAGRAAEPRGAARGVALALVGVAVVLKSPDADWPVPTQPAGLAGRGRRLRLRGDQHRCCAGCAAPQASPGAGDVRRLRRDGRRHRPGRYGARRDRRRRWPARLVGLGAAGHRRSSSPTSACSTARRGWRPARPR